MLNNKKNLLQRVRIAMVAIVAILGVGGAFAMKAPAHQLSPTYGVLSTDATYYYVTAAAGRCDQAAQTCIVSSDASPDNQGRIPKNEATAVSEGKFVASPH